MRRRAENIEAEDATLLAGWMYADLLLGLMVIFLATISFVPIDNFVSKSRLFGINLTVLLSSLLVFSNESVEFKISRIARARD